jgi:ABC-type multidrug transport system fused ATPase/permease subunit
MTDKPSSLHARLTQSKAWRFFGVLFTADALLASAWWLALLLRGILPAVFAVATGWLVGAVKSGAPLAGPLGLAGGVFVLLQVLAPLHRTLGANLGNRTADWLYGDLAKSSAEPPGVWHLEDTNLTTDLAMARDFDLGISAPPLFVSMDFIASGLVEMIAGLASALVLAAYAWWAPLLLAGSWLGTHFLLRESAFWRDRNTEEVRAAQRHADYAYRLAVDAPAAKELRLFGLAAWTVARFTAQRRKLLDLQWQATKLKEKPVLQSLALVLAANILVFWAIAADASSGALPLARAVTFLTAAAGTAMIAFGGLSWALDGAAAPADAVLRLRASMRDLGKLPAGTRPALDLPAREIRFHNVTFSYPGADKPVLDGFDLAIPAGSSLAIVGQNGAGKTTLAKLLCRFYDPQGGAIEIDGLDLRELDITAWRARLAAVFQDFIRFELSLRDNISPGAAVSDELIREALDAAGAGKLASLDTVLSKSYKGGTDFSGGQWQRVALARALCAVKLGAGVVLLDEPTAQLDVRGEAEIFSRLLAATRRATTILISHRFSTVRQADKICVLEHGKLIEHGSHDELMARGGRYRTMFELQASRFAEDEEGAKLDDAA